MVEKTRLDIELPEHQRRRLEVLSTDTGIGRATLARVGIEWLLERSGLLLTGTAAGSAVDLAAFVDELRARPHLAPHADALAQAFAAMDLEGDTVADAAGLLDVIALVVRSHGPLEARLAVLSKLVCFDGIFTVPRPLLQSRARRPSR